MPKSLVYCALAAVCLGGCSPQQQQSAQQGANDAAITTGVMAKLVAVDLDAAGAVHVQVASGVVTLNGAAKSAEEKVRYEQAARSVNGVTRVADRMQVNPHVHGAAENLGDAGLAAKVQAAIFAQAGVNGFHVAASAHANTVTLTGTVPAQSIKETVATTASKVNGVRRVIDNLRVAR